MGISTASSCNCHPQNNPPITNTKGKMKILKKIKRRMGLVTRSNSHGEGTNNLPPLRFHTFCGDNIRISRDGTVARRVESFCKGIAFSSRPIKINEKVCVKFLEISNNWSGVIRFGFTRNDPNTLRYSGLPKYACPDLTNKPGYWAKALAERFCIQTTILFYYVTSTGEVHFGINGEEKGVFFSGVETKGPLWALIDVYGNSTAIEFVDIRHQLNNRRNESEEDIERIACSMQSVRVNDDEPTNITLTPLKYQSPNVKLTPLPFHRTRGRGIRKNPNRTIAWRNIESRQGYVFTQRRIYAGELIVIQVLDADSRYSGCLGIGLTSCDPTNLRTSDLPDDVDALLDRPEYWVFTNNFAQNLQRGDEISLFLAPNGEVQICRNGGGPAAVIHVDPTLRLWGFFNVFGSTLQIRAFISVTPLLRLYNVGGRATETEAVVDTTNTLNSQTDLMRPQSTSRVCCEQQSPTVSTVLVAPTHLAPTYAILLGQQAAAPPTVSLPPHTHSQYAFNPNQLASLNGVSSHFNPVGHAHPNTYEPSNAFSTQSVEKGRSETETECTICYENPIDSVLYMCGHMCMCYECSLQQWRGRGDGHCPLCRAVIRDVVRIYKS